MKTITSNIVRGAAAIALLSAAACGDDHAKTDAPSSRLDSPAGSGSDAGPGPVAFHQVEHLARPGINEALLITNDYMNGYNATAPLFTGVDTTTLNAVVGEAKTVLKAIYLGTCVVDGLAGLTATTGFHPAGLQCAEVGAAVFQADGETLAADAASGAQAYADKVFGQFEPDVMRIDTSIAHSNYLTLCGDATTAPLLCGGRGLTDDTIDVTYNYLLAGAAINGSSPAQFQDLVSDGVFFGSGTAVDSVGTPNAANTQQGHNAPLATFPYSAPPF